MSRKGENIYRRKDGRWEARYPVLYDEKDRIIKYASVYASSYQEAQQKQHAFMIKKLPPYRPEDTPIPITFSELSKEWMETIKINHKEATCAKYRNILNKHLLPYFGESPVSTIKTKDIEDFRNRLLTNGNKGNSGLKQKTVSDILSILKSIQKYGIRHDIKISFIIENICSGKQQKPIRVLSRLEQDKIYNYLKKNMSLINMGIQLCLFTGIRVGELCALRWADINLDEKVLFIRTTMQRVQLSDKTEAEKTRIIITPPKSSSSIRKIPLPEKFTEELVRIKCEDDCFFLTASPDKYIEPRTMQRSFEKAVMKCGIEKANFHALRHTFATRCVEAGFDVKSLSEILGHSNVDITLNRYVHPTMDLKKENMKKFSDLFL